MYVTKVLQQIVEIEKICIVILKSFNFKSRLSLSNFYVESFRTQIPTGQVQLRGIILAPLKVIAT